MSSEIIHIQEPSEVISNDKELIVHVGPVSMDGKDCILISLVPADTNLQSLQLHWEDGGLTYRDDNKYKEWEGCRCEVVERKDINKKYRLLSK